jgi:hypothetical protein
MLRRMARCISTKAWFELELPDAETVEWSSGVSTLKEEAGNKKSNNKKEC